MSNSPTANPRTIPVATRPRLFDYILICVGAALSAFLAEFSEVKAAAAEQSELLVLAFLKTLPFLLFLPVGILLFWPLFYATQRVFGRQQSLTMGEWLWGLAWLGSLALTIYFTWKGLGDPPAFIAGDDFKQKVVMGYIFGMLAVGTLAALLTVLSLLIIWRPQPWTHTFGLVLLMWPLAPLAGLWFLGVKLV